MQGVIGSGLCFVGMSWCVKKRGPVFTAAFSPLVQIIAAIYDVPFMHEQLHLGRYVYTYRFLSVSTYLFRLVTTL